MNISKFHPLFGRNTQLQNEFHMQSNSYLARKLDWTRDVTLNHGKSRWATAWTQMKPECNCDDTFLG